jgi:hypothetical protein
VGTGYAGYTGKAITFNGSGSYDSDGEIVGYEWDVDGDGVYKSSTLEPQLVHTYLADYAGIVTMRVTDDTGRVGLATAPVDVSIDGDSIPEADDNCPLDHNPSQEDEDGDGFGDLCDLDYEYATEEAEGVGIAIGPPPFATILDGPYEGSICEPTPVSGEVGDPEGDAVTPLWIPSEGCSIADPGALATTIACPEEGNYILYLTADDGNGGVVADETSVTVEPDTTPPEVTAALNAKGKVEEGEGKFRVAFSCSDACDTAPSARATLNGIPVPNGQLVKLEIDNHSEVKFRRRIIKLEAPAFTLEVECEDSAGNLSTATAAPAFRSDDDDDRDRRHGRRHRRTGNRHRRQGGGG